MLRFVPLAHQAAADVVACELGRLRTEERRAQPGERLLDALVSCSMGVVEQLGPERRRRRNVDAPLMQNEAVSLGPSCVRGAVKDLLALCDELGKCRRLPSKRIE